MVEVISYESKESLPGILLDKETGSFQIYGKSCPENAQEFYQPIFNWLDYYTKNPLKSTTFDFKMTYFNTVSAKIFYFIIEKMENLSDSGHDVKIRWYYPEGDSDLEEAGEEFDDIFKLEFEFISIKNEVNKTEELDMDSYLDDILN